MLPENKSYLMQLWHHYSIKNLHLIFHQLLHIPQFYQTWCLQKYD